MSIARLAAIPAALCVLLSAHAQEPVASGPLVRGGVTTKVAEHVHVIPDGGVPGVPNVGIVVGSKGTLVIDTGLGRQNGETVLQEAKKISGNTTLYLVTTHVHPEHDLGAQAFPPEARMIRSKDQVAEIAAGGVRTADAFRGRSAAMAQLLEGAEFRKADIIFDREYSLDLGGVKVQLLAVGPNHTLGDTVVFVANEAVVFSGDVAMQALPAFASEQSSVRKWLTSLDEIEARKPKVIVPSHGPLGDVGFVADYRQYLREVRDRTAALKREGKSVEQAVETITSELAVKYPDTRRMGGAVRAAYREAS